MMEQTPDDFQFAFKVTDTITVKKFPDLPRFGMKAGERNADFLNAELFNERFPGACEPYKGEVGLLMFEFRKFYQTNFPSGREFADTLSQFLERLPKGWPFGVEFRVEYNNWLV